MRLTTCVKEMIVNIHRTEVILDCYENETKSTDNLMPKRRIISDIKSDLFVKNIFNCWISHHEETRIWKKIWI